MKIPFLCDLKENKPEETEAAKTQSSLDVDSPDKGKESPAKSKEEVAAEREAKKAEKAARRAATLKAKEGDGGQPSKVQFDC